jgi:TetR/AcrR family transcriptional regulator, tetracycline repressor protein
VAPAQRSSAAPRKTGRAPWGTINREQVVDAAERAVRAGGYQQLTIRSLAADLGVSPMALYQHVRDKDDLLDEVVDRLLARAWKPRADPSDWREWIVEAADRLRRLLVAQPAALHVYLTHPVTSPAALARMDSVMDVLRQALGDEQSAQRAYAAVHTYTLGFAALEGSRSRWRSPQDSEPSYAGTSRRTQRPVSEDPDLAQRLAAYTTPDQFLQGLNYLLDGIDRR